MRRQYLIPLLCTIFINAGQANEQIQKTRHAPARRMGKIASRAIVPAPLEIERLERAEQYYQGDQAFRERRDEKRAREALKHYREYFQENPKEAAVTWRVAMACYFVGFRLTKESDTRKEIFAEGRDAGLAGVKLDEKCAACHFWGALNLALYGDAVGVFKMYFALGDLREHLNQVVKLEPQYASGGAYRLLGLIEQKLPGILGGDNDRAKEYFEKALAVAPDEPLNYLFLAKLQRDDLDDAQGALATARRGLEVPPPQADHIEAVDAVVDLKIFLTASP